MIAFLLTQIAKLKAAISSADEKLVKSAVVPITTGNDGIVVVTDYLFEKVIAVTTDVAENRFCAIRKSASGNLVIFVYNTSFVAVSSVTMNVRIWYKP